MFLIAAPSSLKLYPAYNYLPADDEQLRVSELRTSGAFNFTLRKKMDSFSNILEQQFQLLCSDMVDLRQLGAEQPFAQAQDLLWTYKPAIPMIPSSNEVSTLKRERHMNIDAISLKLNLSAIDLRAYPALLQLWLPVFSSQKDASGKLMNLRISYMDIH